MRTSVAFGVWAYMVIAVLTEVEIYYMLRTANYDLMTAAVSVLATSQATAIVVFNMQLKDEPGAIRLFALIPIMFLSALLIAELASLG